MRLCIRSRRKFEDTFENPQRRKVKQMQPVWLCIHSGKPTGDTHEKACLKKMAWLIYVVQTWLSWKHLRIHNGEKPHNYPRCNLCFLADRKVEVTFIDTHRIKESMNAVSVSSFFKIKILRKCLKILMWKAVTVVMVARTNLLGQPRLFIKGKTSKIIIRNKTICW